VFRKLAVLASAAALAAAALTGSAGAQDAKPTPSGCFGGTITDDTGDQAPFGANMDVKGGWFRYITGKDGKPQLVADIQVANLEKSVTPGWNAHTWWVRFQLGEETQFVIGQLNSDGSWAFHYGADGEDGYAIAGPTTGRAFEGPDGIIEVDIKQKAAGKLLGAPHITARPAMTQGGQPILTPSADRAPDSGGGEDWEAKPCGAAAEVTPPPIGGGTAPAPAALDLAAGKAKLSGKTVSVALTGQATKVTGTLAKGSKTLARGKLAKVAGKATIRLRGSKKIKKGSYTLTLTGITSGGQSATKALAVKLR
jgi:hypothetical protein